jgi:hypothetical protein
MPARPRLIKKMETTTSASVNADLPLEETGGSQVFSGG